MSPFLQQILGVFVRAAIVWLAATFGAEVSEDQIVQWTAQIVPVLAVLAWSIYQKYTSRQKLLTAAATTGAKSEAEIDRIVSSGMAPSVLTPKDQVPA